MSEEEMIKNKLEIIKKRLEYTKFADRFTTAPKISFNYILDMEDLLDLYKQEKEKNEKLERSNKYNIVSKYKIRKLIEKLENYIQDNSDEQGYWGSEHQEEIYAKIEVLHKLLEEDNA